MNRKILFIALLGKSWVSPPEELLTIWRKDPKYPHKYRQYEQVSARRNYEEECLELLYEVITRGKEQFPKLLSLRSRPGQPREEKLIKKPRGGLNEDLAKVIISTHNEHRIMLQKGRLPTSLVFSCLIDIANEEQESDIDIDSYFLVINGKNIFPSSPYMNIVNGMTIKLRRILLYCVRFYTPNKETKVLFIKLPEELRANALFDRIQFHLTQEGLLRPESASELKILYSDTQKPVIRKDSYLICLSGICIDVFLGY